MKMNNKGMTLVELIVTFSILIIFVFGMFNLVLNLNGDLERRKSLKELNEYSNFVNTMIHDDLIKNKPFVIAYKNKDTDNFKCVSKEGECNISNDSLYVSIDGDNESFSSLNSVCTFYPCAIYGYKDNNSISFRNVSINFKFLDKEYGIKYHNTFEAISSDFNVKFGDVYIDIDNNGFFVINFPFYFNDKEDNLGFKIAYPFL